MIGIFDSGVGGLSVWKELIRVLPEQDYIYVSDAGYCPYGPRHKEYVIKRATYVSDFLISKGADLIVVACNTATAASIDILRKTYDIPFVGMEPAIKPAAIRSKSRIIGVLATKGTLKGKLYRSTLKKYASDVKVIEQIGEGLVKLVETGQTESPAAMELLKKYLRPMINQGADYIVLGCTHYPFLQKSIEKITKGSVHIINPAPAIARRVKSIISGRDKSYSGVGKTTFYTTGSDETIMKNIIHSIQYLT